MRNEGGRPDHKNARARSYEQPEQPAPEQRNARLRVIPLRFLRVSVTRDRGSRDRDSVVVSKRMKGG